MASAGRLRAFVVLAVVGLCVGLALRWVGLHGAQRGAEPSFAAERYARGERDGVPPGAGAAHGASVAALPPDGGVEGVPAIGLGPQLEYYPRDEGEWQGHRVITSIREPCNDRGSCGLGRACVDGACGPCLEDAHCLQGEVCVLNNCLRADKTHCRVSTDCEGESLCMIVDDGDYGSRGNEGWVATCSGSERERELAHAGQDSEEPGEGPHEVSDPIDVASLELALETLVPLERKADVGGFDEDEPVETDAPAW